jgi:hypothetical protein
MAGLVPAIHRAVGDLQAWCAGSAAPPPSMLADWMTMDGRDKPGHDDFSFLDLARLALLEDQDDAVSCFGRHDQSASLLLERDV